MPDETHDCPLELPDDLLRFGDISVVRGRDGYIVWRYGTGGNVELTHIKVNEKRKRGGLRLFRMMLEKLRESPPYCTVFGFTRSTNYDAQTFYTQCGFTLSRVMGVYADGDAVVFSGNYLHLCREHGIDT